MPSELILTKMRERQYRGDVDSCVMPVKIRNTWNRYLASHGSKVRASKEVLEAVNEELECLWELTTLCVAIMGDEEAKEEVEQEIEMIQNPCEV